MSRHISFVEALQRGDVDALRRFYLMLVKSGGDHAFWETLKNMAEKTPSFTHALGMELGDYPHCWHG